MCLDFRSPVPKEDEGEENQLSGALKGLSKEIIFAVIGSVFSRNDFRTG